MKNKTRISLTPEQETLLITLYAKAQPENPLFFDPKALEILQHVDYDFSQLKVPYKTVILVSQRTKKIDAVVKEFLVQHPEGVVLHLGCGLDGRFWRVDNGLVAWYDLDMPEVTSLRKHFYNGNERYHLITSSVTDLDWITQVDAANKPVLVVAEGLLMYLSEPDIRRLLQHLRSYFPGCRLIADVFSKLTARFATRHASLRHTGAALGWGIDDPHDIETWGPGIRLLDEWFFSQDPDLNRLSSGYRLMYKLSGAFKVARRAHRIVYYQL